MTPSVCVGRQLPQREDGRALPARHRRSQSRKVILFCLARAREKFGFDLFCVMSNHVHYLIRPADDGLSAWHPAYLRLGSTLDRCARRYEQFCRRYRPEPKQQRRSSWGGWRLWREVEPQAGGQADLFGGVGASYRGGGSGPKRAQPVTVLRPGVLREVERFIQVIQPSCAAAGWLG